MCPWLSWKLPVPPSWAVTEPRSVLCFHSNEKPGKVVSELSWEDIVWAGINSNCYLWVGGRYAFSQQACIEHLLGAGDTAVNKADKLLCSWG